MNDETIKRLREAIAAGPMPGPWMHLFGDRLIYTKLEDGCRGDVVAGVDWVGGPKYLETLRYIAAASPDNIAALLDENNRLRAENEALKADARRYRWLRNEANTARKSDPMVCIYPLDEQELICGEQLDQEIDAAMSTASPPGCTPARPEA